MMLKLVEKWTALFFGLTFLHRKNGSLLGQGFTNLGRPIEQ
jgi:hypothetical protein